jgi:hypothetical protein
MLGEVAWIISLMKDNDLYAQYQLIERRRGKQKAIVAVSQSILVMMYHMLREKNPYSYLGADYFDKRPHGKKIKEKSRCSILFHLLVAGGSCTTVMVRCFSLANFCNFCFQRRFLTPVGTAPIGGDERFALVRREPFARYSPPQIQPCHNQCPALSNPRLWTRS